MNSIIKKSVETNKTQESKRERVEVYTHTRAQNSGEHCIIHPSCTIGENVIIKNFVHLQAGTIIGDNTILDDFVLSRGCNYIGENCIIKPRVILCKGLTVEDNVFISPNVMTAYTTKKGFRSGTYIGKGTWIGTNALIGAGVRIGKNCIIGAHAFLNHVVIGNDCFIGAYAKIGSRGQRLKVKAGVKICDNVSVGDGAMIHRGYKRDTIIGPGSIIRPMALVRPDEE